MIRWINISKNIPEEYEDTIKQYEFSPKYKEKVNFVLENFINKSAFELEAITTLDYVATFMSNKAQSNSQIIEEDYLKQQLALLKKCGYVS
ncbi:MAG: hypothetical protein PHS04_12685 [Tissierellia bacterium]|nr:hypothetical protein [Tissierellia bacterium]